MLFIRRTIIRKHNWAKGRMEWGGGVKGQSRELRILLVESHGHHKIDSL